jgi:hypothetical protein
VTASPALTEWRTAHSALRGYPPTMSDEILSATRAAMAKIDDAERAAEQARAERDSLIWDLSEAGMSPPGIARALDMSVTNVRHILKHQSAIHSKAG